MSEFSDAWGVSYSAPSAAAVTEFEGAVTSYLAAQADTMALVQKLLESAPDMVMALCLRGYLLRLAAHPQFKSALDATLAQAQALVEQGRVNPRERLHVEALALWSKDQGDVALTRLELLLQEHPLDMLALRIAHYLHFYTGLETGMRDSIARVLPAWPEEHPHFSYLLGMYAFGLEEAGDYSTALDHGQRAVAANPADIWATHAVAHVYLMRGETEQGQSQRIHHQQGLDWLAQLRGHWQGTNNFRYHVIWHGALHHLGLGDTQAALDVYDQQLAASTADDFYLDICNNAALLWRLHFLGVDVGDRWQSLATVCAQHTQDQELVFASLHYLIPLAVTRSAHAQEMLTTLRQWSTQAGEQGGVCRSVGVGLAQAIVESIDQPEAALQRLHALQSDTYKIGGSKAQRDVFKLLAADDAQHTGRADLHLT